MQGNSCCEILTIGLENVVIRYGRKVEYIKKSNEVQDLGGDSFLPK